MPTATPRIAVLCLVCACGAPTPEKISGLDPTFGTLGRTLTDFECPASRLSAQAVVKTANGWVAGGGACRGWALAGFTTDGRPDLAFGKGGRAVLFADDVKGVDSLVRSMAVRPDGRILVFGHTYLRAELHLVSATGQHDPAFWNTINADFNKHFPFWFAFALQPDGKVIAADGEAVMRLNPDGTRDLTFGTGGLATPALFGDRTFVEHALVRPDGTMVLVGTRPTGEKGERFVAVLTATGTLDPTFGTNGIFLLTPPEGSSNSVAAAAVGPDGTIVLAGSDFGGVGTSFRPTVWRLTAQGALDPTFGFEGRADGAPSAERGTFNSLASLADGRVVAAGYVRSAGHHAWVVARLTAEGRPDSDFHGEGLVRFDLEIPAEAGGAVGLAADSNGYVVGGRAYPSGQGPNSEFGAGQFGVARVATSTFRTAAPPAAPR